MDIEKLDRYYVGKWVSEFTALERERRRPFLEGKLKEEEIDPQHSVRGTPLIEVLLDEWDGLAS